jgi:predicted  nucleic acid-binding Zn-ribbon protein
MNVLQRKSYQLYFDWLGQKILEWYDNKPANNDLKNCVKAMKQIGTHNNNLQIECDINKKLLSKMRLEKNRAIERARKSDARVEKLELQIEQLELKIKLGL